MERRGFFGAIIAAWAALAGLSARQGRAVVHLFLDGSPIPISSLTRISSDGTNATIEFESRDGDTPCELSRRCAIREPASVQLFVGKHEYCGALELKMVEQKLDRNGWSGSAILAGKLVLV